VQPPTVALESTEELTPYERAVKAAEAGRVGAQTALDGLTTKRGEAEAELAALPDRGARASARVESLEGDDELLRYRAESARLESRLVAERAAYLTAGLGVWERQAAVLRSELELAALAESRALALLEQAEAEAARIREAEAQRARAEAEDEARRAELERDPIERYRARVRAEAAGVRAAIKSFETELRELGQREVREREERRDIEAERNALESRLRLRPRGVEALLRRHLDHCRRALRLVVEATLPEIDAAIEANQVALAEVLDRLWSLRLAAAENEDLDALLAEVRPAREAEARAAFEASLREDGLLEALRDRSQQLEQASALHARILAEVDQRIAALRVFEEFVLARMLWTRSDVPLDAEALARVGTELARLPEPYREARTWSHLRERLGAGFPLVLAVAAALLVLRRIARAAAAWRDAGAARAGLRRHGVRLGLGALWAACPALALLAVAWALTALRGPEAFDPPVIRLLVYQAAFVLVRRVVRVLLGEGGLLVGPRTLPPAIGAQLVRNTRFLTLAGQLTLAPYVVLAGPPFRLEILPRILFTAWCFCVALTVLALLRRRGALVQGWTIEGGLLRVALRFLWGLGAFMLLPVFALDLAGYRVGAQRSMLNGLGIFAALFLLAALFRLLERLGTYWAERAASAAGEEDEQERLARAAAIRVAVRVAAYVVVIAGAVGVRGSLGVGSVLAKLLVDVRLVRLSIEPERWLTAWDAALAVLLLVVGHLVAGNLRALHESLVTPFESGCDDRAGRVEGSRYAFLAILRYALLAVAYGAALLTLGFSFEALGWFATAASVGLGFGLQEIVANFISGLILLFERPVRVGDIVTIGGTSGKVESISIRATVITNWERQTIIVPNKKFVTEDLTNWTRADKVMRRELEVRVAHGSDVERVLRLLDEVVRAHPEVLDEPAPTILFQSFGLFGLEFRVLFHTSIDAGLRTRSELHARISERLAAEGIEIPTAHLVGEELA